MINVGKSFDQVDPDEGKYIVNADAGLQVWLTVKHKRRSGSIGCGEKHLIWVIIRVVLIAQATI